MRMKSLVVIGLGSLALVIGTTVGLSKPAQAESHSVTVSCVGGVPTYSSNNLVATVGSTVTLLNSTGGKLYVAAAGGTTGGYAGWWPDTASNVFTVNSSSGGYIQASGAGVNPCGGMGVLLRFSAAGTPQCDKKSGSCKDHGGAGGTGSKSSGVGPLGSLEGLVVKVEHFSELAMRDEAAALAATTKEAAIAAIKNAIIHEKAALRANEKVLHDLTH